MVSISLIILPFFFVQIVFASTAIVREATCPKYSSCNFNKQADNCNGQEDPLNPCPGGKPSCHTDAVTSEVISCCCIKFDPVYKHLIAGTAKPPPIPGKLRTYFTRFCPYSQRIMLLSVAKNVSIDVVFVNLKNKPEWFVNPLGGKVPIIETEDGSINESLIEADYLDEVYEKSLYPFAPFLKANDRIWIDNYNKLIPGLLFEISNGKGFVNSSEVPTMMKQFEYELTKFRDELTRRGTKYFAGNKGPGMLDYMIWPWIERRPILQMFYPSAMDYSQQRSTKFAEWEELMKHDKAVKAFRLSAEVHFHYYKSVRSGKPDYDMLAGI